MEMELNIIHIGSVDADKDQHFPPFREVVSNSNSGR